MGSGKSRTIRPGIVQQPMVPMSAVGPVPCVQPAPMMGHQLCQPIPQNCIYPGGGGGMMGMMQGPNQWQRSDFSRAYSENVSQIPQQQSMQMALPPQQICYPQQQAQIVPMPLPVPIPQPYPMPIPQPCPMPPMPPCPVPCQVPPSCTMQQPCQMPCPPCVPNQNCGPMIPCPPAPPCFGGNGQFGGGIPQFSGGFGGGNAQQFGGSQGFQQPFDPVGYSTSSFNPQTSTYVVDYGRSSFTPWSSAPRYTQ